MPGLLKNEASFKKAMDVADKQPNRRVAGQDPVKRQQILDGAKRVFMQVGFDAASMNDITREAGVSKGTIYVYFENKEDLFGALIDRERSALFASLADALKEGGTVRETLMRYGVLLATRMTSVQVVRAQRMVIGVTERMPALGRRFFDTGPDSAKVLLSNYLERQIEAGLLDIPDRVLAAQQMFDLCTAGLFRSCIFGVREASPPADEIERVVTSAVEMFLARYGTGTEG
ncbi:TetR/AcrR family transcriptional regulator [Oricola nitratireducens]|uniref:TetR/AcrR family transcriptional regulator n=1 Tax=Oricola nitratireducens TaxID=2775868 RepID=UPI001865B9F7|nr:TetR/AcrR family transcriptional regulator [Oricola nitratireducens]